MAYDAFLKLDGISGESTDSQHEGWIEVLSFSWGETNAGRGASAGGGGGAGKVSFQDFHFSSSFTKASPSLLLACASGKHIPTATLSLSHPTDTTPSSAAGGSSDFLKYELTNVLVSSYQTGGTLRDDGTYSPIGANGDGFTDDVPVDQFTLNFQKIEVAFTSQVDGSTADLSAGINSFGTGSD